MATKVGTTTVAMKIGFARPRNRFALSMIRNSSKSRRNDILLISEILLRLSAAFAMLNTGRTHHLCKFAKTTFSLFRMTLGASSTLPWETTSGQGPQFATSGIDPILGALAQLFFLEFVATQTLPKLSRDDRARYRIRFPVQLQFVIWIDINKY